MLTTVSYLIKPGLQMISHRLLTGEVFAIKTVLLDVFDPSFHRNRSRDLLARRGHL